MIPAITLGAVFLAVIGLIVYLVRRGDRRVDQLADARVAQVATEGELERVRWERDADRKALARAVATIHALEMIPDAATNPDLADDDVDGRLRALARRWAAEDAAAGDPVREPSDPGVPAEAAPEAPGPAAVPGDGAVP